MKSSPESYVAKLPPGACRVVAKKIDNRLARLQQFAAERDDFNSYKAYQRAREVFEEELADGEVPDEQA